MFSDCEEVAAKKEERNTFSLLQVGREKEIHCSRKCVAWTSDGLESRRS